jgi:flagellar capping protein FliD
METQFLTDEKGNKTAVLLSIKKYNELIEKLEDLEDVRLYDEAKKEDDGFRISFEDYVKRRESKKSNV